MMDIRCTQCNRLIGKKVVIRYGEFRCPNCKTINVFDHLTDTYKRDTFERSNLKERLERQ
jgi:phage FluMu protein Com